MERVVITGLGIVCALGRTVDEFWNRILRGDAHIATIPSEWRKYYAPRSKFWSPLPTPDYGTYGIGRSELLSYDRAVLNLFVAADDALDFARLNKSNTADRTRRFNIGGVDPYRVGVVIGTGLGCITSSFDNYVPHLLGNLHNVVQGQLSEPLNNDYWMELQANLEENPKVSPLASLKSMSSSLSASLSIRYGFRGPNETVLAACAAGSWAVAGGYEAIRTGDLDLAICGGSEYYGDRAGGVFMAFDRLGTLIREDLPPSKVNRPFDRDRSGFLFSQGASCVMVLESLRHAHARNAMPLCEIVSASKSSDAYSLATMTQDSNSIERMISECLDKAGIYPEAINYINAHGTGTIHNDIIEASIIERMFGARPLINSTKSLLGHTIGASGAIEAAVTALSIFHEEVHPSLNLEFPIRQLNFATQRCAHKIEYALTENFGFGGHNIGLIFQRY